MYPPPNIHTPSLSQVVGVNRPGQPHDSAALSMEQTHGALQLAQTAGFARAAAVLHHQCGDYAAAILGHLQARQAGSVFDYCNGVLAGGRLLRGACRPARRVACVAAARSCWQVGGVHV